MGPSACANKGTPASAFRGHSEIRGEELRVETAAAGAGLSLVTADGVAGRGRHSPDICQELLEPLLPLHRPELEPGGGVACVAQAVVEGPVLVERQAEAGPSVKEARRCGDPGLNRCVQVPRPALLPASLGSAHVTSYHMGALELREHEDLVLSAASLMAGPWDHCPPAYTLVPPGPGSSWTRLLGPPLLTPRFNGPQPAQYGHRTAPSLPCSTHTRAVRPSHMTCL